MGGTISFIAIAVFMWFVLYHRQPERQSRHRATATGVLKVCGFIVVGILGLAVITSGCWWLIFFVLFMLWVVLAVYSPY